MPLSNSGSTVNSGNSGSVANSGNSGNSGSVASAGAEPTLMTALMTSRYGTIGSEVVTGDDLAAGKARRERQRAAEAPPAPPELRRLKALDPEWRAAVLDARLLAAIWVEPGTTKGGARAAAALCCAGSGQFENLVTIEAPTDDELALQVPCVQSYADQRGERLAEIGAQTGDLLSFYAMIDRLDTTRTPLTLELLALTLRAATYVVQAMKFEFDCPRPMEFSSIIQPMIATPTHSTLPSGHATQAHAVATVLSRLVEGQTARQAVGEPRFQTAARIAINRTVAGLHFPVDSAAGAVLGVAVGEWIAAMGGEPGPITVRTFSSGAYVRERGDFQAEILAEIYEDGGGVLISDNATVAPRVDALLEALWAGARAEWR